MSQTSRNKKFISASTDLGSYPYSSQRTRPSKREFFGKPKAIKDHINAPCSVMLPRIDVELEDADTVHQPPLVQASLIEAKQ